MSLEPEEPENASNLCNETRREGHRKIEPGETSLEFLYRSDRPEMLAICQLLEEWFSSYPDVEKGQMKRRLSSADTDAFNAAYFELYLFTLLRKLGFIAEVPRATAEGQKIEDFQAFQSSQLAFRLEAKYVGQQEDHAWQDGFHRELQNTLDHARTDGIWFAVHIEGRFSHQPAVAKVRRGFEKWYEENRDGVLEALRRGDAPESMPSFEVSEADAVITISPMVAKGEAARSTGSFGIWSLGARWMQTDDKLRRALKRKATRYGAMEVPFIVAASLREMVDETEIANALFGDEVFTVRFGRQGTLGDPIPSRKRNGFWLGPDGSQNSRVSAVFIINELFPWSVVSRFPVIYHNPWAENPLPQAMLPLTQMVPDNKSECYMKREGSPIHEILGLPSNWPHHHKA